ncbi:MAG: DNA repair protein RadA [Acidobacteria bacterium]|nr:DNA repair protein RadA [Acidobacteriota bacterium]
MKDKTHYACQECGHLSPKWLGRCPGCGAWNSLAEERAPSETRAAADLRLPLTHPKLYREIPFDDFVRHPTANAEFDRVLGGGVVPGSLVLLGGEPGIGKSTLLLQIAEQLSQAGKKVLYISGEESDRQIKMRGERLGIQAQRLYLLSETCLERIFEECANLLPDAVIVDSVQTIYSLKLDSAPGTISQVREVAAQFLLFAKGHTVPVFLIGHITKEGAIAGPKALEHIVDAVLYFEGERHHNHRVVRAVKNRFGAANEVGVFEMTEAGLQGVENPSRLFLAERPVGSAGSVVLCCLEGSRPILVELQALVGATPYATAKRMATGVDPNRVSLLMAMLEKRLGYHLVGNDVFLNVAGGITVEEPAADLGIVAAIASSLHNKPLHPYTAVFGEVGLSGEVRAVAQAHLRVREAAHMGFQRCLLPASNLPLQSPVTGIEVIGLRHVAESLQHLFI